MVIDYHGHTPLHRAAGNGQLKIVRFLVEALGCRTDIHGHDGMTPLQIAHDKDHQDVVSYLSLPPP